MFSTLFDHMRWADARAQDEVGALGRGTAERNRAEAIYAHVAAVEHNWLGRLQGWAPRVPLWPALSLADAGALAADTGAAYRTYVGALTADDLAQEVSYHNTAGQAFRNRRQDILLHVALHGSYHRGQLALLARRGGAELAITEYIAFLRVAPEHPAAV
jgi:uncharacterized damage-inducible protein DinB